MNKPSPLIAPFFLSYVEALGWHVAKSKELLEKRTSQGLDSEQEMQVFAALTALLRNLLLHAEGVHLLVQGGLAEAAPPVLRTMYEILLDSESVIKSQDPYRQVIKMQVYVLRDLRGFYELHGERGAPFVQKSQRALDQLRQDHPDAYDEVLNQRKGHWTGKSRSALEKDIAGQNVNIYKILSWDAHAVVSPFRDVQADEESRLQLTFGRMESQEELMELNAYGALSILSRLWNGYAQRYGLEEIRASEPEESDG